MCPFCRNQETEFPSHAQRFIATPVSSHEHLASAYGRTLPAETVFPLAHTRIPFTALVLDQGPAAPLQKGRRARCPLASREFREPRTRAPSEDFVPHDGDACSDAAPPGAPASAPGDVEGRPDAPLQPWIDEGENHLRLSPSTWSALPSRPLRMLPRQAGLLPRGPS